jgi:hypothetical protein
MNATLATACPLRGRLGETRYARLHPTGEQATESALLMPDLMELPDELFGRYFLQFGRWPVEAGTLSGDVLAQLSELLRGTLQAPEVLAEDAMPMPEAEMTAFDGGEIVVRQGDGGSALLLRSWVFGIVP